MNPGMLFDEVLESHEFWPSDNETKTTVMPVSLSSLRPIMQSYWTLWKSQHGGGKYAILWLKAPRWIRVVA